MAKFIVRNAAHHPNTNSSLLSLPGELRNHIYSFVFGEIEDEVQLSLTRPKRTFKDRVKRKLTPHGKRIPHLGLLMTCKQIRSEAFKYVHSIVPAELETKNGLSWVLKQLLSDNLRQELKRTLRYIGDDLLFVTHLRMKGADTLRVLAHKQKFNVETMRTSSNIIARRSAKLSDTLIEVGGHLPNVKVVTVFDTRFDDLQPYKSDWYLALVLLTKAERRHASAVFPLLRDIRIEGTVVGTRYGLREDGKWYGWYGGARAPYIDY